MDIAELDRRNDSRPTWLKGQIPLRYLLRSSFEVGRRPAAIWNLAYHL